jgi:hypothetical protein
MSVVAAALVPYWVAELEGVPGAPALWSAGIVEEEVAPGAGVAPVVAPLVDEEVWAMATDPKSNAPAAPVKAIFLFMG